MEAASRSEPAPADLALRRPTLDEVFLTLTTNTINRSAA